MNEQAAAAFINEGLREQREGKGMMRIYYNVRMYPPAPMSFSDPVFFAVLDQGTLKELVKRGWRMKIINAGYPPNMATKDDPFWAYERKAASS